MPHRSGSDPPEPLLVDLATAVVWTGRPTGTLYRWISEERVTRHGTAGRVLLDLRELPEADSGQGAPERRRRAG